MKEDLSKGSITGVSGPVVVAKTDFPVRMFEAVRIPGAKSPVTKSPAGLLGEVVRIRGREADIQIYGDATGLSAGEEVLFTGELLSVDLGPGFLGEVLDGVGRPLRPRQGVAASRNEKLWRFEPSASEGDAVARGDVLGTVAEGSRFLHRILVPPAFSSPEAVAWIAPEGDYALRDCVCRLENGTELTLTQRWPIRVPRPAKERLPLDRPLFTGQRALDTLFPMALGGAAAMPGGLGAGKTALQRSLAKCCRADVVIYVGCGGRGGEIAELLEEFSENVSEGLPLAERAALVANTSNMPAASRETSVYLGMTLAEYYRDMGYDAVVLVDSVSRWAEALREVGSRLGETPGAGGYPACLESRLSGCRQRAGQVETLGAVSRRGSVSAIGTFSPEGGDLSEPATQTGLRLSGAFWVLDKALAQARRFPAIDRRRSHSLYEEALSEALTQEAGQDWPELKEYLRDVLSRGEELADAARFAGRKAFSETVLSDEDKWLLFHAETLEIVYLRQDARDACSPPARAAALLRLLEALDDRVRRALREGLRYDDVVGVSMRPELIALRDLPDFTDKGREWLERFSAELAARPATDREAIQ
ncbi:MAG: V-type ATP synthase subunit A [Synergistaceae bacterium]|nr:V-type ATP synthase subunit A [Synergistaceae bacterium]